MSDDVNEEVQEGTEEKGEEKGTPGDKGNYASKEELAALQRSVEGMSAKSEQLYGILTSDAFMNRNNTPPVPTQKQVEKETPQAEIDDYTPSQVIGHVFSKLSGILDKQGEKQTEALNRMGATIQNMVKTEADKDADRQIRSCQDEFGKEEFNKQLNKMAKIVEENPNMGARRAYLVAIGEEKPPVKKQVAPATLTEKPGQFADFKDSNLKPKEAAEKAFDMIAGGKNKLI